MTAYEHRKLEDEWLAQKRAERERRQKLFRMLGESTCPDSQQKTVDDAKARFHQLFEG